MFIVNEDNSIYITRGDVATLNIQANVVNGESYTFEDDVIRLRVFERNHHDRVVVSKDVKIIEPASEVDIYLTSSDTKIGTIIDRPVDYWYEVELNPDTAPQTIIGYDSDGPKIFRLFPEGGEKE